MKCKRIELAQFSTFPSVKYGIVSGKKNRVVASYIASTDGPDDVHILKYFHHQQMPTCLQSCTRDSSTSQANSSQCPGPIMIWRKIFTHTVEVSHTVLAVMSQVCQWLSDSETHFNNLSRRYERNECLNECL